MIVTARLITLFVNLYTNRPCWSGNSSSFQTELMSVWIADTNVSPPAWVSSAGTSSRPAELYFPTLQSSFQLPDDQGHVLVVQPNITDITYIQ
jgi:hypothetical protein